VPQGALGRLASRLSSLALGPAVHGQDEREQYADTRPSGPGDSGHAAAFGKIRVRLRQGQVTDRDVDSVSMLVYPPKL
jgi:hypothetical protein